MSQESANTSPVGPLLLTFIAGAALGAVVVALTTPKTGPELRSDLKRLGRKAKDRAGEWAEEARGAWGEVKERSLLAGSDLKRGVTDAVRDLRGARASDGIAQPRES